MEDPAAEPHLVKAWLPLLASLWVIGVYLGFIVIAVVQSRTFCSLLVQVFK